MAAKTNAKAPENGLLIDYEYCTGCYACQVACAQEHHWPAGMGGIRVQEIVQALPERQDLPDLHPVPHGAVRALRGPHPQGAAAGLRAALHVGLHEVRPDRGPGQGDDQAPHGALGAAGVAGLGIRPGYLPAGPPSRSSNRRATCSCSAS